MQWLQQIFRRGNPLIPETIWRECVAQLPFLHRLPPTDLMRLKSLCEQLLAKKPFTGAGGLDLSDDVAVLIAAQACLPVLNLTLDLYLDMAAVIVYPSSFLVPQVQMDEAGVVHEWREPLAGEALEAGGAVVLSWEDVGDVDGLGYNLVIHEFAHKIDMSSGAANGCPPFLSAFHGGLDARAWQKVFSSAFEDFVDRVEVLDQQLPDDFDEEDQSHLVQYEALCAALPLDPYAATHPAEFFAVASETFFVLPERLQQAYPEVYQQLAGYYRQNPLPN